MLSLNKALVKTKFEHDLCDAAFDNLNVKNRLRFNNFAYSIRELTRHILYRLAPDVDIKCCSWYKPTKNENGKVVITRADRINYAIYGGFDNNALFAMGLKDDIDKARKNLIMLLRARSIAMEKKTGSIWMPQDVLARQHYVTRLDQYSSKLIAFLL